MRGTTPEKLKDWVDVTGEEKVHLCCTKVKLCVIFNGLIANFESADLNYAFWMCFFQPSVVGYSNQ